MAMIHNPFASAIEHYGTRFYGSSIGQIAVDPYTSGTFYIWFSFPEGFDATVLGLEKIKNIGITSARDLKKLLCGSCIGVTPPGATLNKIEFGGTGGSKWAIPGSIDYGTSITLKFFEFKNIPIISIFSQWFSLIRSNLTGLSRLITDQYNQPTYSGTLLYWTTDPSGGIQYYAAYDGVFPLKNPQDAAVSDIDSIDKLEIDLEFNVNKVITEDWVSGLCSDIMNEHMKESHFKANNYLNVDRFK